MKSITRFSNRVSNYAKYRPGYPASILRLLENEIGFEPQKDIADIGSGTGLLSKLFLGNDNLVYGVEPNDEMRMAGEVLLKDFINFVLSAEGQRLLAQFLKSFAHCRMDALVRQIAW